MAGATADIAICTGGVGAIAIAAIGGAVASGGNTALTQLVNQGTVDKRQVAIDATIGAVANVLTFGVGGGTIKSVGGKLMGNMKNYWASQITGNTSRRIAGKIVSYSAKTIAKRRVANFMFSTATSVAISGWTSLMARAFKVK